MFERLHKTTLHTSLNGSLAGILITESGFVHGILELTIVHHCEVRSGYVKNNIGILHLITSTPAQNILIVTYSLLKLKHLNL